MTTRPLTPPTPPSRKWLLGLSAAALVAVVGLIVWQATRPAKPQANGPMVDANSPERKAQQARREEVSRMAEADLALAAKRAAERANAAGANVPLPPADAAKTPPDIGRLPVFSASATPQARSAAEAFKTKTHPERLTSSILPAPFDKAQWDASADFRKKYCETAEPGRAYQTATPGPRVPQIALASPAYVEARSGQTVTVKVLAAPGYPVTGLSHDAARFKGSLLTTETVIADAKGVASFEVELTPGITEDCRMQFASPLVSGLASMTIYVPPPDVASTNS